jgi:hypothetical protein
LARQMDQNQLAYRRYDNCFPWVQDYAQGSMKISFAGEQEFDSEQCRGKARFRRFPTFRRFRMTVGTSTGTPKKLTSQ